MNENKKIVITRNAMLTEEVLNALRALARVIVLPDDSEKTLLSELKDTNNYDLEINPNLISQVGDLVELLSQ